MITERGPHGTIAVVTIESDKEVVPHALSVLRNRSCRNCLPVYVRELFGQKQLCVDCTGLIRVVEPSSSRVYATKEARRNAITNLLEGVSEMLDLLLDPSGLLLRPEDVWVRPESGDLYFIYLPLRSLGDGSGCKLSDMDSAALESLLMHDFFSSVVPDVIRHRLTDSVIKGDEVHFGSVLRELRNQDNDIGTNPSRWGRSGLFLLFILLLMLIILSVIYGLSWGVRGFCQPWEWAPIFTISFLLLTIRACIRREPKGKPAFTTETSGRTSASNKEMFFPEANHALPESGVVSSSSNEPGFLIEQSDYGHKLTKKRRCVIWTDDFLIGSDHPLCDFFIDHPSISARHARIVRRQGMFFLVDLGSREGTYIGHRKLFTHEENPLMNGDTIRFGEIRFCFTYDERFVDTKTP